MGRGKSRKNKMKQIHKKVILPLTSMANKAEAVAQEARRLCEELKKKQMEHQQQLEDLEEEDEEDCDSEVTQVTSDSDNASDTECSDSDDITSINRAYGYSRPLPPPPTPYELKEMNRKAAEEERKKRALRRNSAPRQKQWRTPRATPVNECKNASCRRKQQQKNIPLNPKGLRGKHAQVDCEGLQERLKLSNDDMDKLQQLSDHLVRMRSAIYATLRFNLRIQMMLTAHFFVKTPQFETFEEAMYITDLFIRWILTQPPLVLQLARRLCCCSSKPDCQFEISKFERQFQAAACGCDNPIFQPDP